MNEEIKSLYEMVLKTVGVTYGPKGRHVLIQKEDVPSFTKDGQMVFWELWPENRKEKVLLTLVQEAVERVNLSVGDHTTTASLFFITLLKNIEKYRVSHNISSLSQEFLSFQKRAKDLLLPLKKEVETRDQLEEVIFHISNQDSKLAPILTEALLRTGEKGLVSVENGKSRGIEVFQKKGYELESGYWFPEIGEQMLEECLVSCVNFPLESVREITPILEEATAFPYPLLIISKGIFGEAAKVFHMNHEKVKKKDGSFLRLSALRLPGREDLQRDLLEDLAAISGSVIWEPKITSFTSEMFGVLERVRIKRKTSYLYPYEDKEEGILKRISVLSNRTCESSFDQEELNKRIAMLSNGFVVLEVGGSTESEIKERKTRIEDVLSVSRHLLDQGIVPGGAMSFFYLYKTLKDSSNLVDEIISETSKELWELLIRKDNHPLLEEKLDPGNPWVGYDLVSSTIRDFSTSKILADSYLGLEKILEIACSLAYEFSLIDKIILRK